MNVPDKLTLLWLLAKLIIDAGVLVYIVGRLK